MGGPQQRGAGWGLRAWAPAVPSLQANWRPSPTLSPPYEARLVAAEPVKRASSRPATQTFRMLPAVGEGLGRRLVDDVQATRDVGLSAWVRAESRRKRSRRIGGQEAAAGPGSFPLLTAPCTQLVCASRPSRAARFVRGMGCERGQGLDVPLRAIHGRRCRRHHRITASCWRSPRGATGMGSSLHGQGRAVRSQLPTGPARCDPWVPQRSAASLEAVPWLACMHACAWC